jgi:HTH-type transcriptional regulator/antitoxin HigA
MILEADITEMAAQIVQRYPVLREINSAAEHEQALAIMEDLLEHYDANVVLINALSTSIERYEDSADEFIDFNRTVEHKDGGIATLRLLMQQYGLSISDFENEIGKKSMVSQVLNGKRNLTKEHITKLANRFKISPALFF